MKILALGATGAIGTQMVNTMKGQDPELHVTTRRDRSSGDGVIYHQGNARNPAFLATLLKDRWDAIVDFMVYDTPEFKDRVEPLLASTDQYIFFSSARVFANSDTPLKECSPRLLDTTTDSNFLASDEYALAKAHQEDALRATGRSNWTIVRPYITFGNGRLQLGTLEKEDWLFRALQGRTTVFCEDLLKRITTLTDGADVAAMLSALIGRDDALGEDFNLVGSDTMTWDDVLSLYVREIEQKYGQKPRIHLQTLNAFSDAAPSKPQVIYDRNYNRRFETSKIEKFLEPKPAGESLRLLSRRMRSQLDSGNFLDIDAKQEALRDKITSEFSPMSNFASPKQKLRYSIHRFLPQNTIERLRRH